MADFDTQEPKKSITDPKGVGVASEYPRHVHKWAGPGVLNEYRVVQNEAERDAAFADGFSLRPQTSAPVVAEAGGDDDAPKAPKAPKADA